MSRADEIIVCSQPPWTHKRYANSLLMARRFEGQSQSQPGRRHSLRVWTTLAEFMGSEFTLARLRVAQVHFNFNATFLLATPTGNAQPRGIPLAGSTHYNKTDFIFKIKKKIKKNKKSIPPGTAPG